MEKFSEFCLKRMDLLQNHEQGNQITTRQSVAIKIFLKIQEKKGDYILQLSAELLSSGNWLYTFLFSLLVLSTRH